MFVNLSPIVIPRGFWRGIHQDVNDNNGSRPTDRRDDGLALFRVASRRPLHFILFLLFLSPICFADTPGATHFQSGLAYERLGRYDESYTELQLAFALDQDAADVAVALGVVAGRLGRLDVAERALERSIALDSNAVASYFLLGLLYEKESKPDRARDAWQRFLSLNQDEQLKTIAQKHIQTLETLAH